MNILTRYIVKEHIGPFIYSLSVIMFILLMNFLVKYIGHIFGKGIPFFTIIKLIALNLSWMLALAVPMATLIAVLMAFGRFSADNEITILKSSGISIYRIIRPSLYFGLTLTLVMVYFSDQILPETNHQARLLMSSIRHKKPTLQMEEHIFYEIGRYAFLVEQIEQPLPEELMTLNSLLGPEYHSLDELDRLRNITIFDRSSPEKTVTILSDEGYMVYSRERKSLIFTLFDGEFHELDKQNIEDYQRSTFEKHLVFIPAEDFEFEERTDDYRSDREMNIGQMNERVEAARGKAEEQRLKIAETIEKNFAPITVLLNKLEETDSVAAMDSAGVSRISKDQSKWRGATMKAEREAERYYRRMRTNKSLLVNHIRTMNKFAVEIHKKLSIPFASIVFVLVGAPLGVMARRGSMGVALSLSIGFFLLFWVFLIGGEDLADRKIMPPSLAMWAPNIIVGSAGLYLTWKTVRETAFINWDRLSRLFKRKQ